MRFSILTMFMFLVASISAQDSLQVDTVATQSGLLVIGVKPTPPFVIPDQNGGYSGVSIDLWEAVATELNLEYEYAEMELPELLDALDKGSIDGSINPLTVTSERVQAFHFTQPFFISSLAIATRVEAENTVIAFIKNFFSIDFLKAVVLLFLVILVFGLLAWLFERKANPDEFESGWRGVWDGVWWSAVTMTTVGYGDKSPKSAGGRIIALIWMFTAIVIISGFTASIASALTIDQLGAEIGGPDDLKDHKVATVKGSTSEKYLGEKGVEFIAFETPEEALDAATAGTVDAVVYDAPILKYLTGKAPYAEQLAVLPYQFNTQYYAFSVSEERKDLAESINPILLRTIEDVKWKATLNEYYLLD